MDFVAILVSILVGSYKTPPNEKITD